MPSKTQVNHKEKIHTILQGKRYQRSVIAKSKLQQEALLHCDILNRRVADLILRKYYQKFRHRDPLSTAEKILEQDFVRKI